MERLNDGSQVPDSVSSMINHVIWPGLYWNNKKSLLTIDMISSLEVIGIQNKNLRGVKKKKHHLYPFHINQYK